MLLCGYSLESLESFWQDNASDYQTAIVLCVALYIESWASPHDSLQLFLCLFVLHVFFITYIKTLILEECFMKNNMYVPSTLSQL